MKEEETFWLIILQSYGYLSNIEIERVTDIEVQVEDVGDYEEVFVRLLYEPIYSIDEITIEFTVEE